MTLLSRARARAFSFSSFSLQTLITDLESSLYTPVRRSAVRFATLTSEDSGFTLSFSRYSYVFVLIEFYIKFEPKVSSIFFFSKTSRENLGFFPFLSFFLVFAAVFSIRHSFFKSFRACYICLHRRLRSVDYP